MGTRGRKSALELSVVGQGGTVERLQRPSAPDRLGAEEAEVWQRTVDAMPANWFAGETLDLLEQYCRHVVAARRLGLLVDAEMRAGEIEVATLRDLLGMRARETAAMKTLATAMRLTQQASYGARGAASHKERRGQGGAVARPWEV